MLLHSHLWASHLAHHESPQKTGRGESLGWPEAYPRFLRLGISPRGLDSILSDLPFVVIWTKEGPSTRGQNIQDRAEHRKPWEDTPEWKSVHRINEISGIIWWKPMLHIFSFFFFFSSSTLLNAPTCACKICTKTALIHYFSSKQWVDPALFGTSVITHHSLP